MAVAWVSGILLALASLASGQDCSGQLAASRRCMRQFHDAKRQRFETELKPRLDACFVEAGCENPGPVMDEARRCKESVVRDQIVPALQGCPGTEGLDPEDLVAKLAGKGKGHHGKGHHGHHRHHRHHHGGGGMAMKMVAAFCSDRTAAQAAMECVAAVMAEEHGGEEGGPRGEDTTRPRPLPPGPSGLPSQAEFTEDRQRMQCKMEIRDYACLQAKFAAKEALCECSQSWSLDEAAVNEALAQCEPQQLQQSRASLGSWRAEQPLDKMKGKICPGRRGGFRGGFDGGPRGGGFGGPRRSFGSRGSRRGSLGGRSFGRGSLGSGGSRGRGFGFSTTPLPFDGRRRSFGRRGGNRWF